MESKLFIIQKIADFAGKFGDYTYKYWIDETQDNHFIEVIPSTYKFSDEFIDEEVEFIDQFYSKFLEDSLSFVSTDDLKSLGYLTLVQIIEPEFYWEDFSIKLDPGDFLPSNESGLKNITYPNSNYFLAA